MLRFISPLFLLFCFTNTASAAVAEVVWVEFDGEQHHVMLSRYDGEAWSEPGEIVYTSDNPLTTPVLGTAQGGDKILLWAEKTRLKVVLMSARANTEKGELKWQPAKQFSDRGLENLAPAIATDLNGHLWVFWSSSTTLPSDLYYRKFDGEDWSEASRVHKANEEPDNGAVANLDEKGNVVVEWNTFDLDLGAYILENRTYLVENLDSAVLGLVDVVDPSAIIVPDFVPIKTRSMMHFPGNLRTQSILARQPTAIPELP